DYHGFVTDREGETLALEADHRRHAEVENVIRDLKDGVGLNHLPSGKFAANAAWLTLNVLAHNLARWTSRIGLVQTLITTKTLRTRYLDLPGRLTRSARRWHLHLPTRWPWPSSSCWRWTGYAACRSPPDHHRPRSPPTQPAQVGGSLPARRAPPPPARPGRRQPAPPTAPAPIGARCGAPDPRTPGADSRLRASRRNPHPRPS